VSYVSGPRLLADVGSDAAMYPMAPGPHPSVGVGSGATMCPMTSCGPQVLSIKKSLAGLPVKLGTLVPNARTNVSKKPDVRAIMGLQDVRACSVVIANKACGHAATM
jgi:hypothetical protein